MQGYDDIPEEITDPDAKKVTTNQLRFAYTSLELE